MKTRDPDHAASELSEGITRRDFVGTALMGVGAALLHSPCPAASQDLGPNWTGFGGVGDYRFSNGNTADMVRAAHKIRDRTYQSDLTDVIDTGEVYDVVIVGGGFSGISAQHEFQKRRPDGKSLLLDNHAIFGGFAKSNDFTVDGYHVAGAQASINFLLPDSPDARGAGYLRELGLPEQFQFSRPEGGDPSIVFQKATSGPFYYGEQTATVGYYFQNSMTHGKGTWVKNIWDGDLERAPLPDTLRSQLLALRNRWPQLKNDESDAWLDRITFADLVTKVMGLSSEVLPYVMPILGVAGHTANVSAYAAVGRIPGMERFPADSAKASVGDRWMSFPGGNTTLLRHFVKAIYPDAIQGSMSFEAIANNPVNFAALDRAGASHRMRLSSTAVRIRHEGNPNTADRVSVVYERSGQLYRVTAGAAVVNIGSWVAKHIVSDLPDEYRLALGRFFYLPILMVNVALRNWRFLDKLGFGTGRWFDGFGFFGTIRQPMVTGKNLAPFHPDKPIVMTFYVPIQSPGFPLEAEGPAGRAQMYGTSYADYERKIVMQMQRMFSAGGFNARRDIAGIVLNRWGHAMPTPPPGFFFGADGMPPPREVLRKRFGRIAFGHSEMGRGDWVGAADEGKRAMIQVLS